MMRSTLKANSCSESRPVFALIEGLKPSKGALPDDLVRTRVQ